jgi:hypothetical protein
MQERCAAHILSDDEAVVLPAIKLAGRISHNVELCRDLSGASIKTLIAAVARLAGETDSKTVRVLVLWFISIQRFSQAQAAKVASVMITAVCQATSIDTKTAVQDEGISALERLLVREIANVSDCFPRVSALLL